MGIILAIFILLGKWPFSNEELKICCKINDVCGIDSFSTSEVISSYPGDLLGFSFDIELITSDSVIGNRANENGVSGE